MVFIPEIINSIPNAIIRIPFTLTKKFDTAKSPNNSFKYSEKSRIS